MEAQILIDLLGHAGIEARLFNENAQGGLGEIPFIHAYPEVWVIDDSNLDRGKVVVNNYENLPVEVATIFCRACGEESPRNFQLCWHCGVDLEAASHHSAIKTNER